MAPSASSRLTCSRRATLANWASMCMSPCLWSGLCLVRVLCVLSAGLLWSDPMSMRSCCSSSADTTASSTTSVRPQAFGVSTCLLRCGGRRVAGTPARAASVTSNPNSGRPCPMFVCPRLLLSRSCATNLGHRLSGPSLWLRPTSRSSTTPDLLRMDESWANNTKWHPPATWQRAAVGTNLPSSICCGLIAAAWRTSPSNLFSATWQTSLTWPTTTSVGARLRTRRSLSRMASSRLSTRLRSVRLAGSHLDLPRRRFFTTGTVQENTWPRCVRLATWQFEEGSWFLFTSIMEVGTTSILSSARLLTYGRRLRSDGRRRDG